MQSEKRRWLVLKRPRGDTNCICIAVRGRRGGGGAAGCRARGPGACRRLPGAQGRQRQRRACQGCGLGVVRLGLLHSVGDIQQRRSAPASAPGFAASRWWRYRGVQCLEGAGDRHRRDRQRGYRQRGGRYAVLPVHECDGGGLDVRRQWRCTRWRGGGSRIGRGCGRGAEGGAISCKPCTDALAGLCSLCACVPVCVTVGAPN